MNTANSGGDGRSGWTHEAGLFEGARTDLGEILGLLAVPSSAFMLQLEDGEPAGCAYVKHLGARVAYMGLLSVRPRSQAHGIGSALIAQCERIAREEWQCETMRISVITSHRPEVTAFYERRGYSRTGRYKTFERRNVRAKVAGLVLEWMEKDL